MVTSAEEEKNFTRKGRVMSPRLAMDQRDEGHEKE
jgi:hypothetical protein